MTTLDWLLIGQGTALLALIHLWRRVRCLESRERLKLPTVMAMNARLDAWEAALKNRGLL